MRPGLLRRVVAAIMIAVGLLGSSWVLMIGYGPRPAVVSWQLSYLDGAIADGAPARMQELFPEGAYFTYVLTGLAEAADAPDAAALDRARSWLAEIDDPASTAIFGSGMSPEHGAFAAGWSLSLAVAIAQASREPADLERVRTGAAEIEAALREAASPFLASYPGQYWPCDTVVAVGALAQAADVLKQEGWRDRVIGWRAEALQRVDPATGLLPHRVDADGTALEGPRGSSNSIIQAFWPLITSTEPADRGDQWKRFVATFVTREAGLVGVREYPRGLAGSGDVDSGPLILGVSASASAVTLAAARVNGDAALASDLDREADLLGVPLPLPGGLRYGLGVVPVGDAFLVWARTRPVVAVSEGASAPRPWWVLYALPGLVVAGLGVLLWRGRR